MPPILLNANKLIEESKIESDLNVEEYTHETAFMVLTDLDGNYIIEPDINKPIIPKRKPNNPEIKAAMSVMLMDMSTQETAVLAANHVVGLQMQMAKQMQEAKASMDIQAMLAKGK